MLWVGVLFYKKTNKMSDYFLGGRKLNSWVTSLSAQASDMSGWLLMGLPGYAYAAGMEAAWIAIGLAAGTYLNWKFIAKRLRKYTQIAGNSITLPDYFENRFKDNSKSLRLISAIIILVFFLIYTASGFVAGGKLFNTVFGIPYITALIIGVFVVVSYTFLGGFMAVCWTDLFQGMLMFFAIIIVPTVGINLVGGPSTAMNMWDQISPELLNPFTALDGTTLSFITIISGLAWGVGYLGQPHILIRFMAIRSADEIKKARIIAMVWVIISLTAAIFVGLVGMIYLQVPLKDAAMETVFMVMAKNIFPVVIAGIFLAAVLAAIMSTADSQLLVTASAISGDIYKAFFRKKASEKELLWVSRFTVIGVSIISFILALNPNSSVLKLVAYAWAGFGAAFGPAVLLSLFWKRMTRNGALAGIITGGITVIIWRNLTGGIYDLYEIVPGFLCALIAIVIVSLLDKEPSGEIIAEFDKATIE